MIPGSLRATRLLCALVAWACSLALSAAGQDAGTQDASAPAEETPSPAVVSRAAQVRALIEETLDVRVSAQDLFDVALDDEAAIAIEATRLRALIHAAQEAARPPEPPPRPRSRRASTPPPAVDAGALRAELASLDPARWSERLELDAARLAFYDLGSERRAELLRIHAAQQEAAEPKETEEERLAREAEAERASALEAARAARSEAERVVSEELARLITLETNVRAVNAEYQRARAELAVRRDALLGWQRRARDAKASEATNADATYEALRRTLRVSRDDLSVALDDLSSEETSVPTIGADALVDVPLDIPTDAARERRELVEQAITSARRDERALRRERASTLLDEIRTLNRERLGLLTSLSPSKRDAVTGFTAAGWDQARSEARHLSLILRYHQHVVITWVTTVRSGDGAGLSPWRTTLVLLPLVLLAIAFTWGRRRSQALLRWSEARLLDMDRAERRTSPSVGLRAVRVLLENHRPLEWILLFLGALWLMPSGTSDLLEVQLVSSIITWTLVGSLTVNTVHALAADSAGATFVGDDSGASALRLRSLKLVGRTIVVFGLFLVLSDRLVGQGTIYSWAFSSCWFAAIPVFLMLVRWWRGIVFARLERLRKKTPLQAWILANRSGWKSFAAAMLGALQLFATGTLKTARGWLSSFDLARRIHAYLFRREIERMSEGHAHTALTPLPAAAFEKLHPERPFGSWLPCPADELRVAITERAQARRGSLHLLVSWRGMGKSSLLRILTQEVPNAKLLQCHHGLRESALKAALDESDSLLLLDDAHTLIEARIGGLARFDRAVTAARANSRGITCVFAVDASVWPLLKRARDARPMFDETHVLEPWTESQLGALLADRCAAAAIVPRYDQLLDELPKGADEIDRQDALNAKREGYERMLWDHVGGNPGLALTSWRISLGQDATGTVLVRPLQVPDISRLERLPDTSLFILRVVLQLAPTTADAVAQATRLRPDEVEQDFRFGKAQGFYEEHDGHVRIAWGWLRAVSRLLERRHLLVSL